MNTNAQAALQAAATVFAEGRQHTSPDTVLGMAYVFKRWLDKHDTMEQERAKEPEVSHHISCSSRKGSAFKCTCQPVPYMQVPKPADQLTLWTVLVRPRNTNGTWQLVKVVAGSADQATSIITAQYPGHAWSDLTDTGELPPKPGPRLPFPPTPASGL